MSVSLPLSGWNAAVDIRYDAASHDSNENELKDDDIGPAIVAMIVLSIHIQRVSAAPRTF